MATTAIYILVFDSCVIFAIHSTVHKHFSQFYIISQFSNVYTRADLGRGSWSDSVEIWQVYDPGLPGVLHHSVKLQTSTPGYSAERVCREELLDLAGMMTFVAYTIV
jgi:hypothetical protein